MTISDYLLFVRQVIGSSNPPESRAQIPGSEPPQGPSTCKLVLSANLAAQDLADEVAGLPHFGQGQGAEDDTALATGGHDAGGLQDREVLREVCPGNSHFLLQGREAVFSTAEHVEHVKAFGMGKGFANDGLSFEDFLIERRRRGSGHRVVNGLVFAAFAGQQFSFRHRCEDVQWSLGNCA